MNSVTPIAQPPSEAPPLSRLSLPYKVMKSLDRDVYRNLEFDVWQDNCKGKLSLDQLMVSTGNVKSPECETIIDITTHEACPVLTEMQKAEYMVFAGRQYFLGDKCQVTLAQPAPSHTPHVFAAMGWYCRLLLLPHKSSCWL